MEAKFTLRKPTWKGLGINVAEARSSEEALAMSGLDWDVYQQTMTADNGIPIMGYKANIRDVDDQLLGVVTDKYQVVQNKEAFAFTDELLGQGVRYETAGMLQDGRKTWILARLPQRYQMLGDWVDPFLVFYNSHDGSGSIKVALTPIRVTCQNSLNLALRKANRVWSTKHTGEIHSRMDDARETLFRAEEYMDELNREMNRLADISFTDKAVEQFIEELIPVPKNASSQQERNVRRLRNDLKDRYYKAPDLRHLAGNGYKLINAVSDFATHAEPLRKTDSYQENLFAKTLDGNPMIDKAHRMILQAA
ncbi:MAG: DUF932 domain-containing protein [Eubacterium sp.]